MFGEDVKDEETGQLLRSDVNVARDEYGLFGRAINDDKDGVVTVRVGEFLNEIHGDRIPWSFRDRKGLQKTIRAMSRRLVMSTNHTRLDIIPNKLANLGPSVLTSNCVKSTILAKVTGKDVVMIDAKDAESEVIAVRNVDTIIKEE